MWLHQKGTAAASAHRTWHLVVSASSIHKRLIQGYQSFGDHYEGHLASWRACAAATAARAVRPRGLVWGMTLSSGPKCRRLRMGEWICSTRACVSREHTGCSGHAS
jgi:hypothetical protein